eukprot:TRINITY_DN3380_c3_g1_i2.p1 TRINITY_DN3380_c3_g1~~TRINITY_DN3380_c3_g1_i2.p1  ORF type:complete len:936 (-),score=231.59 TRINITY_DN3380_c3_g1_i2:43-2850(-)
MVFVTELWGKTMAQPLPKAELAHFKSVPKLLETKQYKKIIKLCDGILKKVPDHGETLAVKAFAIRSHDNDKKDEVYALMDKAIKKDGRSYICWHAYGLLKKHDREWQEALKAFRNAVKADENNYSLLNEIAHLLAQVRDLPALLEVRRKLLQLKPSHKANWIGFAVAHHLVKDYAGALDVLNKFEAAQDEDAKDSLEHGEMLLFRNVVLEEMGDFQGALKQLLVIESKVADTLTVNERKALLLLKMDKRPEAVSEYRKLLRFNPENANYHRGYRAAVLPANVPDTLSESEMQTLHTAYKEIQKDNPRATAPTRIPLDFLQGDAFKIAAHEYISDKIAGAKPALFAELKNLYADPAKAKCLEELILSYESSLKKDATFPKIEGSSVKGEQKEGPTSLLFTLFYLAQHFDWKGESLRALAYADEATAHTPTLLNVYRAKAHIYKHGGDPASAAAFTERARSLDLADRYLNTKSTKYLLRADFRVQADSVVTLFTKDGPTGNNLFEMQASWYELELGDSLYRSKQYGEALVQYTNVEKHFADFVEDQYDFHSYCMRKLTLRTYLQLLQWENTIYAQPFFVRAATGIVKCYLAIAEDEEELAAKSAEERAKIRAARRKAAKAAAAAQTKTAKEQEKDEKKENLAEAARKLAAVPDPLAEANKYVDKLREHVDTQISTHLLAFNVFFKRKKHVLALQSLKKALAIDPANPTLHVNIVKFFHGATKDPSVEGPIKMIVDRERSNLLGAKDLTTFNNEFYTAHADSLAHRVAAAQALSIMEDHSEVSTKDALSMIAGMPQDAKPPTFQEAVEAHRVVRDVLKDEGAAATLLARYAPLLPLSAGLGAVSVAISKYPLPPDGSLEEEGFEADGEESEQQQSQQQSQQEQQHTSSTTTTTTVTTQAGDPVATTLSPVGSDVQPEDVEDAPADKNVSPPASPSTSK